MNVCWCLAVENPNPLSANLIVARAAAQHFCFIRLSLHPSFLSSIHRRSLISLLFVNIIWIIILRQSYLVFQYQLFFLPNILHRVWLLTTVLIRCSAKWARNLFYVVVFMLADHAVLLPPCLIGVLLTTLNPPTAPISVLILHVLQLHATLRHIHITAATPAHVKWYHLSHLSQ